ncbi:ectoine synthase, partial [Kitasatospora sp. NPDC091257]|uniref:ectoine synthase n=1 Tax=Kitasatospora sp. NPDC091257 TaxID=3364084 RepID=UPI0037F651ED
MLIRDLADVKTVEWGNGLSRRFLVESDNLGYSLTDTIVNAGTKSRLEYRNHLEACYCIAGSGEVIDMDGNSHPITPGRLYALDEHDAHYLVAGPQEDLR